MGKIRTVLGDVEPAVLGVTHMHEHVITHPPASVTDRDLAMESVAAATRELSHFHQAGGRGLVEMTPRDYGRDPLALREISAATGVHIISAPPAGTRTSSAVPGWRIARSMTWRTK